MKTVDGFEEAGFSEAESHRYAFLSFFGGMLVLWLLDKLVHLLLYLAKKSDAVESQHDTEASPDVSESEPGGLVTRTSTTHEPQGCELTSMSTCVDECACSGSEVHIPVRDAAVDLAMFTYSKEGKDSAMMSSSSQDGTTVVGDGLSSSQAEAPAAKPVHVDEGAEALVMLAASDGKSTVSLIRTGKHGTMDYRDVYASIHVHIALLEAQLACGKRQQKGDGL